MGEFPNKGSQFKPGQSGNPKGMEKGTLQLKVLIRKVWDEEVTDAQGNKVVAGLLVVKAMYDKALKGDVSAFNALADRMEGKPKQGIDQNIQSYVQMPMITRNGKEVHFDIGKSIK